MTLLDIRRLPVPDQIIKPQGISRGDKKCRQMYQESIKISYEWPGLYTITLSRRYATQDRKNLWFPFLYRGSPVGNAGMRRRFEAHPVLLLPMLSDR